MDVEKTVQFLLEQQAVFAARMGKLHTLLEQMAINEVAIEKGQARFDTNMRELQDRTKRSHPRLKPSDQRVARLDETQAKREALLQALIERIDRLIEILNGRFGTKGSVA